MNAKRPILARSALTGTTSLGADWVVGDDGVKFRRAARVVVLTRNDDGETAASAPPASAVRALLIRGHDADQPSRSWWFTVGGGIDAGETPLEAAVREVREEIGVDVAPDRLVGPVMTRLGKFHFYLETAIQDETFFAVVLTPEEAASVATAGWTETERRLLDEMAWMTAEELRTQGREYFPTALPDVIDRLGSQLIGADVVVGQGDNGTEPFAGTAPGWDGVVVHLGEEDDDATA
jgi:8-oxo-dGTP pyrophosphatase MutT (NUDIX family)